MSFEHMAIRFGDLLTSEGTRNGIYKSKEFHGRGAKIVNMGELFAFPRLFNVEMKRVDIDSGEEGKFSLKAGDLLFARRSLVAEGAGKCSIVKEVEGVTVFESSIIRARVDATKADSEYLYYTFSSVVGRNLLGTILRQTAVSGITGTDLVELEIPLPPVAEQKAIAHILGTLDDKIQLNRKTNETLEAMAKALFKSWFVDFDPVRAKAEGRPTGLPAEISDLFPDSFEDSELGEIPSGWRVAPVGDVVECVGGSTPLTNEIEYWDGGEYFWATPKDLSSLSEPFLLDTAKKITADGVQRISSGILPVGTILLSSRAPVGYVAAACVPVSINQGFIALKSNGLMSSAYLLNWCLSNVQQFKDRASGTTFAEISKAAFRPIPLLVPSEQVARLFSDKSQTLYERVVSSMRQSTLLAATRDALLPKLISGEIRIPDAERMLEEVGI
jgi:type I restriction enzyme S subunit